MGGVLTFGEQLRQWREAAGLTQDALAEALEVTQQTVSDWEAGDSKPRVNRVGPLARVLKVDWERVAEALAQQEPQYWPAGEARAASGIDIPADLDDEERALLEAAVNMIRARRSDRTK